MTKTSGETRWLCRTCGKPVLVRMLGSRRLSERHSRSYGTVEGRCEGSLGEIWFAAKIIRESKNN